MNELKRFAAFTLAMVMVLALLPANVMAGEYVSSELFSEPDAAVIVRPASARPGDSVIVDIDIANNPGFADMNLRITFDDEVLTFVSAEAGRNFSGGFFTQLVVASPVHMGWGNFTNLTGDGTLVRLTFDVDGGVDAGVGGVFADIEIDFVDAAGNTMMPSDVAGVPVPMTARSGFVFVYEYLLGDVNGDGRLSLTDVGRLSRYLVQYPVNISSSLVADVDGSGAVSMVDIVRLQRYIFRHPGVYLVPSDHRAGWRLASAAVPAGGFVPLELQPIPSPDPLPDPCVTISFSGLPAEPVVPDDTFTLTAQMRDDYNRGLAGYSIRIGIPEGVEVTAPPNPLGLTPNFITSPSHVHVEEWPLAGPADIYVGAVCTVNHNLSALFDMSFRVSANAASGTTAPITAAFINPHDGLHEYPFRYADMVEEHLFAEITAEIGAVTVGSDGNEITFDFVAAAPMVCFAVDTELSNATFPIYTTGLVDGTFEVTAAGLPPGVSVVSPITITNDEGTLELTGTPTQTGTFTPTFTIETAISSATTGVLAIEVEEDRPPRHPADINNDGRVNIEDLTLLRLYLAGHDVDFGQQ